jgi:hypothetical protein
MAGHSAQDALACQDFGRAHACQWAQMLLSQARCQGTLNPAHAHCTRCSHIASHRSPVQHPQDYNLAHSSATVRTSAPSALSPADVQL